MANPLVVAALATLPRGPGTGGDGLTGLPSTQAKGLGTLGLAQHQYYDDNIAPIQIRSGTGTSASGTVGLYLVVSEDGVNWTDGINPNVAADQSAKLANASSYQIYSIPVNVDSTLFYFREFSVVSKLLFMPSFWAVVIWNQSGAALDPTNTNFRAQHSLVDYA